MRGLLVVCALAAVACCVLLLVHGAHPMVQGPGVHVGAQVVVARYGEDLSWLSYLPFTDIVVYDKNDTGDTSHGRPPPHAAVVSLPNVGRCDHSYLHHIVANYDRLADVTLFLPGSCANFGFKWDKVVAVVRHVQATGGSAFPATTHLTGPLHRAMGTFSMDTWEASDPVNSSLNPESALLPCPQRPFSKWYLRNFPARDDVRQVVYSGIFAVSRQHILQRSRDSYARLLSYLDTHSNPEAGHYLERAWFAVFYPVPPSCWC